MLVIYRLLLLKKNLFEDEPLEFRWNVQKSEGVGL